MAARVSGNDYFGARLIVQPGGQVRLQLVRTSLGIETVLGSVGAGSKYKAGQVFWLRLQTLGSSIQAKSWADGKVEPASWQLSVLDLTPLVGASVGFGANGAAGLSNVVEIATDDFSAIDPNAAGSVAPCPGGTASYSGLALGGHVFRVRVSAASNQATAIYPWTINPPAPTVTITSGPPTNTTSRSAEFTVDIGGVTDSVTCSLDSDPYPSGAGACLTPEGSVLLSDLDIGAHTLEVTATNVSGNGSDTWTWEIFPSALPLLAAVEPTPATSASDPPVLLRVVLPSGSQASAADFNSGRNFEEEIIGGCLTPYGVNETLDCSGYGISNLPPASQTPDPVPNCIIVETGDKTGQLRAGFHGRFESPCTANNWSTFPSLPADDPRIVYLFVVPPPTPSPSGNEAMPITGIVRFYITGWDYHPTFSPGCPDPDGAGPLEGNEAHPIYGPAGTYQSSLDNGDIWGHFIP